MLQMRKAAPFGLVILPVTACWLALLCLSSVVASKYLCQSAFHCCDRIPEKNSLQGGKGYFDHGF